MLRKLSQIGLACLALSVTLFGIGCASTNDRGMERVERWREARYAAAESYDDESAAEEMGPARVRANTPARIDEVDDSADEGGGSDRVAAWRASRALRNDAGSEATLTTSNEALRQPAAKASAFLVFTPPGEEMGWEIPVSRLADGRAGVPFGLEGEEETLIPLDIGYDDLVASGGNNLDMAAICRPMVEQAAKLEGNDIADYVEWVTYLHIVVR